MTTAPNHRPPGFDAALVAYLPTLRIKARMMLRTNADDAEELLQAATVRILNDAGACKMETFKVWAQTKLTSVSADRRRYAGQQMRAGIVESIDKMARQSSDEDLRAIRVPEPCRTAPTQEHSADLSDVLGALRTIPNGDIVLRRAMGELLTDIGAERGCGRENVRQLEAKARRALVAVVGREQGRAA